MQRMFPAIAVATALMASVSSAQTTTNITVTPSSTVFDCKNVVGVPLDAAPGFPFGSLASTGGPPTPCASGGSDTKTDAYFTPESLFGGRSITLGEVASMSYWTKKTTLHSADPHDWYLTIYTKPYTGDVSTPTWYGDRIGSEPYFSEDLTETADAWNQWSTGGPTNELRFFESTAGAPGATFGSYTDPDWSTLITRKALSGSPYAGHAILYFSIQTGSAWSTGFTGQVDGYQIRLTEGSVANINFEPFVVATDKDACKSGGWASLYRADGTTFKNQGDCIQYVNTGK